MAACLVVHLITAVEDIHHDAESPTKVLGRLCLACACRALGSTAQDDVHCLRKSDVASIRERRNDQAAAVPNVLIAEVANIIADVDLYNVRLFVHDKFQLRHPRKVRVVLSLDFNQGLNHIACMHVHGNDAHNFAPVIAGKLPQNQRHKFIQLLHLLLVVFTHRVFIALLHLVKGDVHLLHVRNPRARA